MFHRGGSIAWGLIVVFALGACDSSGAEVVAAPDNDAGSEADALTPPPGEPPRLSVTSPSRGSWIADGEPTVLVSGTIEETTGNVSSVEVNEAGATVTAGGFSFSSPPRDGLNILSTRAETDDGERAVDGRAFFYGPVHPPATTLPNAVRVHAAPAFLDDNDPDADDVASIAEGILAAPGTLSGLLQPIDTDYALLTPTSVAINSVSLDITPLEGAVRFLAFIDGLVIEADVDGKGAIGELLTGKAKLSSSNIELTIVLSVSVEDGVPNIGVDYTNLLFEDFAIESEAIDAFVEQYRTLGAALVEGGTLENLVKGYVSGAFEEIASTLLGDLLIGFLEGFAYDTSFGEAPRLDINLTLNTVSVSENGLDIGLDAAVSAPVAPLVPIDPERSGSLATTYEAPTALVSDAPVWFLIDDDLINQVLFAFWAGGVMTGLDLQGDSLAALDLSDLPLVFSPLSRLEIDTLLPPTITARGEDNVDHPYLLGVGEMVIVVHTETGRRFECSLNAETGFGLDVLDDASGIAPLLDAIPRNMTLAVGCDDVPPGFDPGSVAALLRVGLPPILRDAAAEFVYAFPDLPIGSLVPIDALADATLSFSSLTGRVVGDDRHLLLIEAAPVLSTPTAPAQ